ncbi:pol [Symbiodinium sp. CCMP2592]|nr:pol [Symbiodinium sp. CCMP2592]
MDPPGVTSMQVEQAGSPTEVADEISDSEIGIEPKMEVEEEAKLEKRKREEDRKKKRRAARERAGGGAGETEEDELDSPSKRASVGGDLPLTARELRELLCDHRRDMTEAWRTFEDRVTRLEKEGESRKGEIASIAGRTKVNERDIMNVKKAVDQHKHSLEASDKKVDLLVEDVKNLKVQLQSVKTGPVLPEEAKDPWGEYIRQQQGRAPWVPPAQRLGGANPSAGANPLPMDQEGMKGDNDVLSEEDKRTLIVGGWSQDTRRMVIEEESRSLLEHPEIKPLLDVDKIAVYGPRRSVGMVKFTLRDGEKSFEEVKKRMWQVVRIAAQLKLETPVITYQHGAKVTIELASDSKDEGGGVLNEMHVQQSAYDMDWSAGTIWCGLHKLGSATHRKPKDAETVLMSGGWVNLDAVGLIAGCSVDACFTPEETGENWEPSANGPEHGTGKSKTTTRTTKSRKLQKWGRLATWNLGGQDVHKVDVAGRDLDIVCVQEVARGEVHWTTENTDNFHWVLHRSASQWRAVGVGIASDKLDCIVGKVASTRGVWILARLRGLGRVVLGSMHCHTGATNAIYQAAVQQFVRECPGKWRQYPCWCGIDANEQFRWAAGNDDEDTRLVNGSTNLNDLANQLLARDLRPIAPCEDQWHSPTHFPRDTKRRGRQIDAVWNRQLKVTNVTIDAKRRHIIGTDHALLYSDLQSGRVPLARWGNDSRPRYMRKDIPSQRISNAEDLADLAKKCTGPRFSHAYRDPEMVLQAMRDARQNNDAKSWKAVHRLRRRARRQWEAGRLSAILHGDWYQYRTRKKEKNRRVGWWGNLLKDSSSTALTQKVENHLKGKLENEFGDDWDDLLQQQIEMVEIREDFEDFTLLNVREALQEMKPHSAVGPDGISVGFLRAAASHDEVAPQLLQLINDTVANLHLPAIWQDNFLALLAKVDWPQKPNDLRPICVSSAFHKLVNKMVCSRVMPAMRTGSKVSGCGRGRQAADVIGTLSRVRDLTQEWRLPTLLCKLDISGAFDRIDRQKIAEFLKAKLQDKGVQHELKFMLCQLRSYRLIGQVPGGNQIHIEPNIGIKQGAPESAEIFGLVMDEILSTLTNMKAWGDLGQAFDDTDLDLVFYQDDIFVIETELVRLGRKVKVLERCLGRHGLHLASEKTKIIASPFYKGCRRVQVGGTPFEIAKPGESIKVRGLSFCLHEKSSQQARELLGRTRDAAMGHRELLRGHASWTKKVDMMKTLVESQFAWTAGAVHWSAEDLRQANILQIHTMRTAFRLFRKPEEKWHEWNARTMRHCRAWLASNGRDRWSTVILRLQHTLVGHWARRQEWIDGHNDCICSLPMRALLWRNTEWWRGQQQLSARTGIRHKQHVFVSNIERALADSHGVQWFKLAQDRARWAQERTSFLAMWDVKWCQGRQLALPM